MHRLLVLSFLALALAACSNDPNPAPLEKTRPDGSPWVVRYWGMPDDPRSLDPQFAYEETSRRILEPVYDCLLEYDPLKTDPYELVPCLLTEMPQRTVRPDGGEDYLCHLKPGVHFHDDPCFPGGQGRELVAQDVAYAFKRVCDPKVACPVLSTLADFVSGMNDLNAEAVRTGQMNYNGTLSGCEVLDEHSFVVHLTKPYPQIVYWMAMHFLCPVAREAVEFYDGQNGREDFKWHPVGDGPFVFVNYTPGQRARLRRNPNYITTKFPTGGWPPEKETLMRPLAGHALPLVDEVQITIFREALPIFILTRQGYLDAMAVSKDSYNSVVTSQHGLAEKYRKRGMSLDKDVEPSTFYASFNMEDPVIGKNAKLRQALSCSFNRDLYLDIFFNGVPTVAQQLLPPGVPGFDKEYQNPYRFDLEHARQLMVEAGYPNGMDPASGRPLELTMETVSGGALERQMAEYEQRQFEQLGIHVTVNENNFAHMLEKEDSGAFQIASGSGWNADYPDAENFFFLLYGKNFPPQGKNINRYHSPEFDQLFEKMATMASSPERLEIIAKMNHIIAEDCPNVYFYNRAYYSLIQPWAPRTQHNAMLEGGLKYSRVEPGERMRLRREWNERPLWPIALTLAGLVTLGWYGYAWNRTRHV